MPRECGADPFTHESAHASRLRLLAAHGPNVCKHLSRDATREDLSNHDVILVHEGQVDTR